MTWFIIFLLISLLFYEAVIIVPTSWLRVHKPKNSNFLTLSLCDSCYISLNIFLVLSILFEFQVLKYIGRTSRPPRDAGVTVFCKGHCLFLSAVLIPATFTFFGLTVSHQSLMSSGNRTLGTWVQSFFSPSCLNYIIFKRPSWKCLAFFQLFR